MSWFFRQSQPGYVGSNVQIGSYNVHIESVLAEGGFSIVYLANAKIQNAKSSKAALKRMFVNDEETLNGCKNEIQVMRKLTGHKNIVRYLPQSTRHESSILLPPLLQKCMMLNIQEQLLFVYRMY